MRKLPETVPAAAKRLLVFIGQQEAPQGYGTIYGNNQRHLSKSLTEMTYGDIVDAQVGWSKKYGSSAAGLYQFMRNTLIGIAKDVPGLRGDLLFTPGLQDRLGFYLLLRRGWQNFVDGKLSIAGFGLALAQEWASFPVLQACSGATRVVERGQSYYAGDGINKALVSPDRVEEILKLVLAMAEQIPEA